MIILANSEKNAMKVPVAAAPDRSAAAADQAVAGATGQLTPVPPSPQ